LQELLFSEEFETCFKNSEGNNNLHCFSSAGIVFAKGSALGINEVNLLFKSSSLEFVSGDFLISKRSFEGSPSLRGNPLISKRPRPLKL
jgi:hypothetical protein